MKFIETINFTFQTLRQIFFWNKHKNNPNILNLKDPLGENALRYLTRLNHKTGFSNELVKTLLSSDKCIYKKDEKIYFDSIKFNDIFSTALLYDRETVDHYINFITNNFPLESIKELNSIKTSLNSLDMSHKDDIMSILMNNKNQDFRNLVLQSNFDYHNSSPYMDLNYLKKYILQTEIIEPLNFYNIVKNKKLLNISNEELFEIALKNNFNKNFNKQLEEDYKKTVFGTMFSFESKLKNLQNEKFLTNFFIELHRYILSQKINSNSDNFKETYKI